MKRHLLAGLTALSLGTSAWGEVSSSLEDFYPKAYRLSQARRDMAGWRIACSRPGGQMGVLSLLADQDGRIVLAAYSKEIPEDVKRLFDVRQRGGTRDWAWLFDRAGRGAVDYAVFFMGSQPVKPLDFRADFPKGRSITRKEDGEYLFANVRNVFYHAADDNHDGRVDAVIYPVVDSERPAWIDGFAVMRSSRFDTVIDTDWLFRGDIRQPVGPVPRNAKGLQVRLNPEEGVPVEAILPSWNAMFADFNRVLRDCGLEGKLPRE